MSLTYSTYLKLDTILGAQETGGEHDEMLFIIIHQVYELWFKQVLHELDDLAARFLGDPAAKRPPVVDSLKRVLTILKTMVAQVDILETMTPTSFNSFRQRLETASGFQSPQFRELEFLLGMRADGYLKHHQGNAEAVERLEKRLREPSIYQCFLAFLVRSRDKYGELISPELFRAENWQLAKNHEAIREVLVDVYRNEDGLRQICERLVDLDEGLQEWRYRHVKMVQRTIGSKPGTGGSDGVGYLQSTLSKSAFPDLWAIRSRL